MKFYRIERRSEQTFYALANGEADLAAIIGQSDRFLPIEHAITPVESGDIPSSSNVFVIDDCDVAVQRVGYAAALSRHRSRRADGPRNAIEAVKEALLESGSDDQFSIQLRSSAQAITLLQVFADEIKADKYHEILKGIRSGAIDSLVVSGVRISWPLPVRAGLLRRLGSWFWPGGNVVGG
jgi:galactokinase